MSERSKERDSREADLLIVKIRLRWKAIFTRMCAIIRVCYALVGSNPTSAIFLSRRICCSAHCLDEKVTIIMSVNFKYSTIKYVWGLFSLLKNWESSKKRRQAVFWRRDSGRRSWPMYRWKFGFKPWQSSPSFTEASMLFFLLSVTKIIFILLINMGTLIEIGYL